MSDEPKFWIPGLGPSPGWITLAEALARIQASALWPDANPWRVIQHAGNSIRISAQRFPAAEFRNGWCDVVTMTPEQILAVEPIGDPPSRLESPASAMALYSGEKIRGETWASYQDVNVSGADLEAFIERAALSKPSARVSIDDTKRVEFREWMNAERGRTGRYPPLDGSRQKNNGFQGDCDAFSWGRGRGVPKETVRTWVKEEGFSRPRGRPRQ